MKITLEYKGQEVLIENGELLSYRVDGYEFMHQKGSPGWRNTDTEMFPVIGPTAEAGYRVQVPRGNAIQDQHGQLRDMAYLLAANSANTARFIKEYNAGSLVENAKYPEKSTAKWLLWPYSFHFVKSFELGSEGLHIHFEIRGDKGMPFMLGYHPAFKLRTPYPFVSTGSLSIPLEEVLAAGSRALQVADTRMVRLHDEKVLTLKTSGFRHFMLWTEAPGMLCVEPITFYPYAVSQQEIHLGFDYLEEPRRSYGLQLIPG